MSIWKENPVFFLFLLCQCLEIKELNQVTETKDQPQQEII